MSYKSRQGWSLGKRSEDKDWKAGGNMQQLGIPCYLRPSMHGKYLHTTHNMHGVSQDVHRTRDRARLGAGSISVLGRGVPYLVHGRRTWVRGDKVSAMRNDSRWRPGLEHSAHSVDRQHSRSEVTRRCELHHSTSEPFHCPPKQQCHRQQPLAQIVLLFS